MIDLDSKEHGSIDIFIDGVLYKHVKNKIVGSSRSIKAAAVIGGPSADFISSLKLGKTSSSVPAIVFENEKSLVNVIHEIPIGFDIDPKPYIEDDPQGRALSSVVVWTGIVPVDVNLTFDEAGLFSSNGYMWSRATFSSIIKPIGVTMSIRWKIQF